MWMSCFCSRDGKADTYIHAQLCHLLHTREDILDCGNKNSSVSIFIHVSFEASGLWTLGSN